MKAFGILAIFVAMIVSLFMFLRPGAGPDAGTPQNAPQLIQKAEAAVDKADLGSLVRVISAFQSEKERLPTSLEELKELGYIDRVPDGVIYDPATGQVRLP